MSCGGLGGPPYGIPIQHENHERYSPELKKAWKTFDIWWKEAQDKAEGGLVDRNSMPSDVKEAYDLINRTFIPGFEGYNTGADSCYMIGVNSLMTEEEK